MSSMRCGCNVRMQRAVGVLRIEEDDFFYPRAVAGDPCEASLPPLPASPYSTNADIHPSPISMAGVQEWHLDREAPVCDLGEDEEAALCRSFDAANEEERLSAALESGRARGNSRLWPPT
ncbi:hypothetical protein AB1Y20_003652 [Prymnesium parvum]|uniref:Uncharacterized protein n=1 Tax=Prymnesium parvum TaxID=97485 RepID=A0AB34J5V7_PRYPA